MAAPNIQNLFERFLQIYGGQGGSTKTDRPEQRYQSVQPTYSAPSDAYGSEDSHATSGGVLRGFNSPSANMPSWAQALAGPGAAAVGLRGPRLGVGIRGFPFLPMPPGPNDVAEIPNPHLERFIPQSMRDFWNAATVVPQMLGGQGQDDRASTPPRSDPKARELRTVSGAVASKSVPEEHEHPLRLLLKGMYGDGAAGDDAYSRCLKAADGERDDWENFCRFLDRRQNNTVGGESQNRACWSKSLQSNGEKRNYCYNQFSKRQ